MDVSPKHTFGPPLDAIRLSQAYTFWLAACSYIAASGDTGEIMPSSRRLR